MLLPSAALMAAIVPCTVMLWLLSPVILVKPVVVIKCRLPCNAVNVASTVPLPASTSTNEIPASVRLMSSFTLCATGTVTTGAILTTCTVIVAALTLLGSFASSIA